MKKELLNDEKIIRKDPYLSLSIFISAAIISLSLIYSAGLRAERAGEQTQRADVRAVDIIPKGVPVAYGAELGISYDDIDPRKPQLTEQTIEKLAIIDTGKELSGNNLKRYVDILYRMEGGMSCEYCCDARSVIFENGDPACGCAHSYAMRGLTKHLISEYGGIYSDKEIYEEIGKWKTLFFPDQISGKTAALKSEGIELSYTNLTSNKFRGIEQGIRGGMVGDC